MPECAVPVTCSHGDRERRCPNRGVPGTRPPRCGRAPHPPPPEGPTPPWYKANGMPLILGILAAAAVAIPAYIFLSADDEPAASGSSTTTTAGSTTTNPGTTTNASGTTAAYNTTAGVSTTTA